MNSFILDPQKRNIYPAKWISLAFLALFLWPVMANDDSGQPPSIEESAAEPLKYTANLQTDKRYYDGKFPHAVGVHHYQVFRANRTHPTEGGETGYTYNHAPFLAYWNGQFYLQFLSGLVAEHTPPTRTMLTVSEDGRSWSDPLVVFPPYELPEIRKENFYLSAGTMAVMHQRMGFYLAPNGRLLTLAFYSYCPTPRYSPNKGQGLGRVVREIYRDGSFGPIYFIRYNRHAGWDESNTRYPFYSKSDDREFVEACETLLADRLMTLQWWEEDRGEDGFFAIDPSRVQDEDPAASRSGVTTSAGAGKAFCYYQRPDGVMVGLWKNQYSALSPDEGKNWTPIVKSSTLMTCGAKVWGQRTEDSRYALVYNHSATRRNRFPLVVMTGSDGHEFDQMFCLQGEVPPQRFQGIHKNVGPQYVRGIMQGNGDPPGDEMWNVYSMNKEDIWVSRTRVPVSGRVEKPVEENFNQLNNEVDLVFWNLYMPKWAPIRIVREPGSRNRFLELKDQDPYDYALAECMFPAARALTIEFKVLIGQVGNGSALEIEVQDRRGSRPMRLRFDEQWLGLDRAKVFPLTPIKITTGKWYDIKLVFDCRSGSYDLAVNGAWVNRKVAFAENVESLEKIVFRSGPYRGDVRLFIMEEGEPRPAGLYSEDLAGGDRQVAAGIFWIDDVKSGVRQ